MTMLAQDRRGTLRLMAEELGISEDTVNTIIHEDLGEDLFPVCAAQADRRTESRTDGNF